MASMTNGTREADGGASHVMTFAPAAYVAYDDPMSKVLGLDAKTSGIGAWFGFTSGSTALLVGFAVFASYFAWLNAHRPHPIASSSSEIEILREEPPPPPPPPPRQEEEKPAPPPPAVHIAAPREAPPPPPAPAQAAKVLTQEPDPNQPVDMTNTIVQGNADSYAGGMSASNGTSTTAVHGLAAATGTPGSTGPVAPAPPPAPDRSRQASWGGGGEWNCPFPPEADVAQVDDAYVTLQADVRADGMPTAVRVLADPGNGFGREARRCAMNKRYVTALDHDGNPIAGTTRAIKVHFTR